MDESNVLRLHKKVPKQRTKQKPNERKTNTRIALRVKVSSLKRGGIGIGVILGWLMKVQKTCINTLERLDPQIQNNQFKLYDKQLVCGK